MGKQGPCCHCGVTRECQPELEQCTPLWRNGPPEKPVLCNACGSRWRTKGTLVNYTPLHARADVNDYEDHRSSRMKSISVNKNKEVKLLKRKSYHDTGVLGGVNPDYNLGYRKAFDEDTSNRSSSGSAISNSESCAPFGGADTSELTGPSQSIVWDTMVPSKKRTCVNRPKPSPVEKLTKDLYTILHEQQSSCFSGSSEEDLLFESETPMVSVEIGHGSVLIRHPSSIAREEESEASSLSVENKQYSTNEAYSHFMSHPVYSESKSINRTYAASDKDKNPFGKRVQQAELKRDNSHFEKLQILENHNSPLCNVDLNLLLTENRSPGFSNVLMEMDILNFEEFARNLTTEEQQQLLKYLPPVETAKLPDSLKNMLNSPQFKEDMLLYQKLLAEGVFDLFFSGAKTEDCKTVKRLALFNLSKSKWVEHYHELKKCTGANGSSNIVRGQNGIALSNSTPASRVGDNLGKKFPEARTMKSPKRIVTKATFENKEIMDNDISCFSPRSLFAMPPDGGSLMLDTPLSVEESSDQDLLLDVPCSSSFPQAELLHPTLSFGPKASTSSSSIHQHQVRP